jgi:hypothetical protein
VNISRKTGNDLICRINRIRVTSWRRGLVEILLVASLYAAYTLTQGSLADKAILAVQHSYHIVSLEKTLRVYWELGLQSWVLGSNYLIRIANGIYTYLFYPALIGFAVWAYNRHQPEYKMVRNIFLVSTALGLVCFAIFPAAPPRLLPQLGFVDTIAGYEALHYDSTVPSVFVNQYAAMPSFHFGWTLLVGVSTCFIAKMVWLKALGALLPAMMLFSIIATGNHFVLDAVGGALVMLVAFAIVKPVSALWNRYSARSCQE